MTARVIAAVLNHLKSIPTFNSQGIEAHRKLLEKSAAMFKIDPEAGFEPLMLGTIPGAWISPPEKSDSRVILYLHGGGFMAGSIKTHRDLATRIARAASTETLLIDYRLAPEHPFPAGLDDAFTTYQWLLEQKHGSGIILAGDSAGGGLVLSLALRLKKEGVTPPLGLVLISPWTDLRCQAPSILKNEEKDPMFNQKLLQTTARLYAPETQWHNPLVSPLLGDLSGLSPMLIQAGTLEVLQDDSILLKKKADELNVPATLDIWDNMFHVWHYFARYLPQGRRAIQDIGRFIRNL